MNIDHDKYERLSYDRDQGFSERWGIYQAMQDAIKGIQDQKAELRCRSSNLWNFSRGMDVLLTTDLAQKLPEEAKIARRIKLLERERDAFAARAAATEEPLRNAVQFLDNCAAYLARNPTGTGLHYDPPPQPSGPIDLPAVRAQNAELKAERRRMAESTYQREEARALVAAGLDRAAAAGTERVRRLVAFGDVSELFVIRTDGGRVDLLPMLAALLGKAAVADALLPYVEDMPASIPADERAAILADLDARILALEEVEEAEICRREALGEKPGRRGDADPAVVLRMRAAA